MASPSPAFFRLWRDEAIREKLISELDTESICALRLTAPECCQFTTRTLFTRIRLTFTPSAFTRASRIEALSRIGHYIEHLTFSMPHTDATFLPPLLNPKTGREVTFLYTPHTSIASVSQRPKYGCPELGDVLTQQYPPIFHAATNVPAFINAMSNLPNLRHLTISCPGQDPAQRYRRDSVDYALISLRIAIERALLPCLEKLSISQIHPSGLLYLRNRPGYGCTPSSGRRWKQIRKLNINMDSWDFLSLRPGLDHLKILDDYIRGFSSNLEKVSFGWNGRRGPCPFTLFTDPLLQPPRATERLFCEITSPMSPLPAAPPRLAMNFPKLRYVQVRNAAMSEQQVADFVLPHRETVKEFDFDNVTLTNGGSWENAMLLSRVSGHDEWSSQRSGSSIGSFSSTQYQSEPEHLYQPEEVFIETAEEVHVETVQIKRRRLHRRRKHKRKDSGISLNISHPIPISAPCPELLQPTAFIPNVQGVQRNFELDAAQQELAEDPEKRKSALKKAREAVLKQLGKEFNKNQGRKEHVKGFFKGTCSIRQKGRTLFQESNTALVPLMFSRY